MRDCDDTGTRDLFPAHIRLERERFKRRALELRERANFFRRCGYHASAARLDDEAVRLQSRAVGLLA